MMLVTLVGGAGTLDKHTSGKLLVSKLDSAMATITAEFATAAKAKAQILVPEGQASPKKLAAEVAQVSLLITINEHRRAGS